MTRVKSTAATVAVTLAVVGCGGAAATSDKSKDGVRAAATQLVRSVNDKDWFAVRDQMTTSYYHLVGPLGLPNNSLAGVLPQPVNDPPLTTADVPIARVTLNGSRARIEFLDGAIVDFTYERGRWLVDG
jgi:hypothetical protein